MQHDIWTIRSQIIHGLGGCHTRMSTQKITIRINLPTVILNKLIRFIISWVILTHLTIPIVHSLWNGFKNKYNREIKYDVFISKNIDHILLKHLIYKGAGYCWIPTIKILICSHKSTLYILSITRETSFRYI